MRMIMLGGPGSGKGTQGEKLAQALGVPHLSTGEALRNAVRDGTELGRKAKPSMDAGTLVPDEILVAVVRNWLAQPGSAAGFILDGYPRRLTQAQALDTLLRETGTPALDFAVDLEVAGEELVQRLLLRAREQGRADDRVEVIRNRIRVYEAETRPLLDYYTAQGKLLAVPGSGTIDEVFQRILARLATARGQAAT